VNLPEYNFLSAPLWLITILHVLTLTLHFAAMNVTVGGIIVLLFGKLQNKWTDPLVQRIVKLLPTSMAATVTLGVAPLLFAQLTYYDQLYSASIISAWFWLLLVGVAIVAYYFLYGAAFAGDSRVGRIPVYLGLALVGFVYISWVYSTVFSLAERPDLYRMVYAANQSGWAVNPDVGSWIFRWLHMLAGAVTVGGFFVGLLGRNSESVYDLGKRFFLWGMMAAMLLGLAYLFTFGEFLLPLMRSTAIWLLLVAVMLSLLSLHFFFKRKFVPAGLMVFVSLLLMVTIRHTVRLLYLEGYFDPAAIPVNPQWSIFLVFLVFFVIALGLVWYMLKLFFTDRQRVA